MKQTFLGILSLISLAAFINSCSKGSGGGGGGGTPTCTGVTINVTATTANPTTSGGSNGSINASATGGSGFTYSINGGAFQSSGSFTGLVAGAYTITAKSSAGCTGAASFTLSNPSPTCTGVTINVTATTTNDVPCGSTPAGAINATATGSTGLTYSINGTTFQATGNFTGLAAGSYTVTAKDLNGCTGTTNVTINNAAAGPLFTAVKGLMATNCVSCHNPGNLNGGMNWTVDCNIVQFKDRIKVRAVDQGTMPPTGPLPQSEKDKITNWINAGGRYTD